jgi:hypothetical protein
MSKEQPSADQMSGETNQPKTWPRFNQVEPLMMLCGEEASVLSTRGLISLNGWVLNIEETKRVRDWLNEVIP